MMIGHNHIGHKIYDEFIWHHRDDTSRFRVVRMVNLNVKEAYVCPSIAKMNVRSF